MPGKVQVNLFQLVTRRGRHNRIMFQLLTVQANHSLDPVQCGNHLGNHIEPADRTLHRPLTHETTAPRQLVDPAEVSIEGCSV